VIVTKILQQLIIDDNSVLGLLHTVDVGDAVGVSEVHAASILRAEMCRFTPGQ
jgi:hypothetical protein